MLVVRRLDAQAALQPHRVGQVLPLDSIACAFRLIDRHWEIRHNPVDQDQESTTCSGQAESDDRGPSGAPEEANYTYQLASGHTASHGYGNPRRYHDPTIAHATGAAISPTFPTRLGATRGGGWLALHIASPYGQRKLFSVPKVSAQGVSRSVAANGRFGSVTMTSPVPRPA